MKQSYLLLFVFWTTINFAQLAFVEMDSQGFKLVRSEPYGKAPILLNLKENQLVWYDSESYLANEQWVTVYVSLNKYDLESKTPNTQMGYVAYNQIRPLKETKRIIDKSFFIEAKRIPFEIKNNTIERKGEWIQTINGRSPYGIRNKLPNESILSLAVNYKERKFIIEDVFLMDIFEWNNNYKIYLYQNNYIIYNILGEKENSYEVAFVLTSDFKLSQRIIGVLY